MSREARASVLLKIYLSWQDARGAVQRCAARCVDISPSGALVETEEELKAPGDVVVYSANFTRMGHATVRYCRRHDPIRFRVGLEFSTALKLGDHVRQETVEASTETLR